MDERQSNKKICRNIWKDVRRLPMSVFDYQRLGPCDIRLYIMFEVLELLE